MLLALHIPDGFLPLPLCIVGWVLGAVCLALASYHCQKEFQDAVVPRMGLLAAFVLVSQTLQFPVPGGTSAHLQGSALAGLLLGPWNSVVVLSAVIGVQGFVLGDGGILTMGWNIVNMGVLGCWSAVSVARLTRRRLGPAGSALLATWVSVMSATLATCAQLAWADTSPLSVSLPPMLLVQSLVGLGEAFVTMGAVLFIARNRPHILAASAVTRPGQWALVGLTAAGLLPKLQPPVLGVPCPVFWIALLLLGLSRV